MRAALPGFCAEKITNSVKSYNGKEQNDMKRPSSSTDKAHSTF